MSRRADMRLKPIGTGPFKFVEFKPNELIKVARNPDYWKPGRPYLDAHRIHVIANPSTAILAFVAGKFDRFAQGILSLPLMKQLEGAGAAGGLRSCAVEHPAPAAGQPRQAALRQPRTAPRDGTDASTARRSSTFSATARARSAAR